MKTEAEIRDRIATLERWCVTADEKSNRELALLSATNELEWVLIS